MQTNREQLCHKITEIYPDIGHCGIDVDVTHDPKKEVWIVDLKKGPHELQHHLEYSDAQDCLTGKQCVSLALEISQLRKNIEGKQF